MAKLANIADLFSQYGGMDTEAIRQAILAERDKYKVGGFYSDPDQYGDAFGVNLDNDLYNQLGYGGSKSAVYGASMYQAYDPESGLPDTRQRTYEMPIFGQRMYVGNNEGANAGNFMGIFDDQGNLQDVKWQRTGEHEGWAFENWDTIMAALAAAGIGYAGWTGSLGASSPLGYVTDAEMLLNPLGGVGSAGLYGGVAPIVESVPSWTNPYDQAGLDELISQVDPAFNPEFMPPDPFADPSFAPPGSPPPLPPGTQAPAPITESIPTSTPGNGLPGTPIPGGTGLPGANPGTSGGAIPDWIKAIFGEGAGGLLGGLGNLLGAISNFTSGNELRDISEEERRARQGFMTQLQQSYNDPSSVYAGDEWQAIQRTNLDALQRQDAAKGRLSNDINRQAAMQDLAANWMGNYRSGLAQAAGLSNPAQYGAQGAYGNAMRYGSLNGFLQDYSRQYGAK